MEKKIKKQLKKLYDTANSLGLSNKDIESIINSNVIEPVLFSTGPFYHGAHYGTISINDFN